MGLKLVVPAGVTVIEGVRLWSFENEVFPFIGIPLATGFLPLIDPEGVLLMGGLMFCVDILWGSDT